MSITSKEEGERVLESNLTVTSPFLDGIGSYTCTAENVVDTANSTAEVTVYCELLPGIVVNEKGLYLHPPPPTHCISHSRCLPPSSLLPSVQPNPSSEVPRRT